MASFIDSHAHLADPAFDVDRDATIERARQTGALAVVSIGESRGAGPGRGGGAGGATGGVLFLGGGGNPQ
jgi:hypothetical protein